MMATTSSSSTSVNAAIRELKDFEGTPRILRIREKRPAKS
jgi:hypothetical protein